MSLNSLNYPFQFMRIFQNALDNYQAIIRKLYPCTKDKIRSFKMKVYSQRNL